MGFAARACLLVYFILSVQSVESRPQQEANIKGNKDFDINTELIQNLQGNFLKSMGIFLLDSSIPNEIRESVYVLMKQVLNDKSNNDYWNKLVSKMLLVKEENSNNQLVVLLEAMEEATQPDSPTAEAAKIIREFLTSPEARQVVNDLQMFIKGLIGERIYASPLPVTTGPDFISSLTDHNSFQRRNL